MEQIAITFDRAPVWHRHDDWTKRQIPFNFARKDEQGNS
jgi:hypothetical protein